MYLYVNERFFKHYLCIPATIMSHKPIHILKRTANNTGESNNIEDICFFEVITKYISPSELKTSEFSRVRSTSENVYVLNSRNIFGIRQKKANFLFILYNTRVFSNSRRQAVKMQKPKIIENTIDFGTTLFLTF